MLLFLFLLPIALSLVFFVFRQMQVDLAERESRAICRRELLRTQEKAAESLTRLLDLNSKVRAAKATRDAAVVAMHAAAAAWNPVAFGIAFDIYQGALRALQALRIAQKALLLKARMDLWRGLQELQSEMRKGFERQTKTSDSLQTFEGHMISVSTVHVAVRPRDTSDPYPEYELEEPFAEKQGLQASWKMRWQHLTKRSTWTSQDWRFERTCAATLIPDADGGTGFKARLSEDRFSLKSFFFF